MPLASLDAKGDVETTNEQGGTVSFFTVNKKAHLSLSRLFLSQSSMRAAGIFTNAKPCEDTGSRVRLQTHLPFDLVSPRILKSLYEFVIHTAPWISRDSHSGRSVFQRAQCFVFEHRASLFGAPFRTQCTHPYVRATRPSSLML